MLLNFEEAKRRTEEALGECAWDERVGRGVTVETELGEENVARFRGLQDEWHDELVRRRESGHFDSAWTLG
jgi:hypothetical protein